MSKGDFFIGVDEAGRGPLAGPVAVATVMAPADLIKDFGPVKDSKHLSPANRLRWYDRLSALRQTGRLHFAYSFALHSTIDRLGIVGAVDRAVRRTLEKLPTNPTGQPVLLDGSLRAPAIYHRQETIIGGDQSEPIIALASIIAKVARDRRMRIIDRRFPAYGFAKHKGYATEDHYLALLQYGPCPIHRRSFLSFLD